MTAGLVAVVGLDLWVLATLFSAVFGRTRGPAPSPRTSRARRAERERLLAHRRRVREQAALERYRWNAHP